MFKYKINNQNNLMYKLFKYLLLILLSKVIHLEIIFCKGSRNLSKQIIQNQNLSY